MPIMSVIKNDAFGDMLCSKIPCEDFNVGSQLIVTEYEEALFMKDGIIEQDYSLNAGRYVGVVIEDDGLTEEEFKGELYSLNAEFASLSAEAKKLEELISNNLKGLLGE